MSTLPEVVLTPAPAEAHRAYAQTLQIAQSYRTTVSEIGRSQRDTIRLEAQLASISQPGTILGRRLVAEAEKAEKRTDALLLQEREQAQRLLAAKVCLRFTNRKVTDPVWLAQSAQLIETANRLLGLRSLLFSWDLKVALDRIRIPANAVLSGKIPADSVGSCTTATDDNNIDWREVQE
jgi:hypothetical protein